MPRSIPPPPASSLLLAEIKFPIILTRKPAANHQGQPYHKLINQTGREMKSNTINSKLWKGSRRLSILAAAFVAVSAGPRLEASDVMFVLDASGSMRQTTADGVVRINAAKQAFAPLTETFSEEQVALMIFGHRKSPKQPGACQDIEVAIPFGPMEPNRFRSRVNSVKALGNTPLASSLLLAKDHLLSLDRDSQKAVIVLTDGNETCGGDPAAAAAMLAQLGINVKVHVVGFAVNPGEEAQLVSIAAAGGGEYVSAHNAEKLKQVLPEIVKTALLTSEDTELERAEVFRETFDGDELGAHWEVLNPDDSRYAPVDGKLLVLTQFVAPWQDNENIANFIRTTEPVQARDYEVEATISLRRTMQHHGAALLLHEDADNYLELAAYSDEHGNNLKRVLRFTKSVQGKKGHFYYDMGNGAAESVEELPVKLVKRGVIFTAWVELPKRDSDEKVWVAIGRHGVPGLDKPHLALKAANGENDHYGSGKVSETEVNFDDIVVTSSVWETKLIGGDSSEASFTTDFDNLEAFSNDFTIVNHEDSHLALDRGLNIVSQYGAAGDEENPIKNFALLNKSLPEGDWDAEVQVSFQLSSQKPQIGLVLFEDDANFLLLGRYGKDHGYNVRRQDVFRKFTRGTDSPIEGGVYRAYSERAPQTHLFKIEKRGRKYTGKIFTPNEETGEHEWLTIGEQTVLRINGKLGLVAHNLGTDHYGSGPAHEVVARFERLRVIPR
ncbi:MAG: hypothetical protein CMJ62_14055 [Planctomycetaceae bacterium]|nr:hypothetical protein [Planctomycetaceae bacterium]